MRSATTPCPQCGYANLAGSTECTMCGAPFEGGGGGAAAPPPGSGPGNFAPPGFRRPDTGRLQPQGQQPQGFAPLESPGSGGGFGQGPGPAHVFRSGAPGGGGHGVGSGQNPVATIAGCATLVLIAAGVGALRSCSGGGFGGFGSSADYTSAEHGLTLDLPSGWVLDSSEVRDFHSQLWTSAYPTVLVDASTPDEAIMWIHVAVVRKDLIPGAAAADAAHNVGALISANTRFGPGFKPDPPTMMMLGDQPAQRMSFRVDYPGAPPDFGILVLSETKKSNMWLLGIGFADVALWDANRQKIDDSLASIRLTAQ